MQMPEVGTVKVLATLGFQPVTSGAANILGVCFNGTGTGSVQFFAGVTGSSSMTPVISFCGTSSSVAGGFAPMFLRTPLAVPSGFSVNVPTTTDPSLLLYWQPVVT